MPIKLVTLMIAASQVLAGCVFLPMSAEEKAGYAEYHRTTEDPATYLAMNCADFLATKRGWDVDETTRFYKVKAAIQQAGAQRDCSSADGERTAAPAASAETEVAPSTMSSTSMRVADRPIVGALGFYVTTVTETVAKSFGLPNASGALVLGPVEGIPADDSALLAGDVIFEVAGTAVSSPTQLTAIISPMRPGSKAALRVWRYKQAIAVSVEVSPSP